MVDTIGQSVKSNKEEPTTKGGKAMLTEREIEEIYGKSIWDMTVQELIDNDLTRDWVKLVDAAASEEDD